METARRFGRGHLENQRNRRIAGRLVTLDNPQARLHRIQKRHALTMGLIAPKLEPWKEEIPVSKGQIILWDSKTSFAAKIKPLEF